MLSLLPLLTAVSTGGDAIPPRQETEAWTQRMMPVVQQTCMNNANTMLGAMSLLSSGRQAGDWFQNPELSLDSSYSRQRFDGIGSGYTFSNRLGLSSEVGSGTLLGGGVTQSRSTPGDETESLGGDLFVHQEIDEHYGFAAFILADQVDIPARGKDTGILGAGLSFTSFHDLGGGFDFSSIHTLSWIDYELNAGLMGMSTGRLAYSWSESLESSLFGTLFHDFGPDVGQDNTWFDVGVDCDWMISDSFSLGLSYSRKVRLEDVSSHCYGMRLVWAF
ncbi:MAG: hypothetical protein RL095_817 [Verrucomicrobiota bacterium]|jgi:hypothetical protein